MRRLACVALLSASAYALVWGMSWLVGDRSAAVFGRVDAQSFSNYPGVLFGGLPPTPSLDSDLPQLVAAVAGFVGIAILLVVVLRRRVA